MICAFGKKLRTCNEAESVKNRLIQVLKIAIIFELAQLLTQVFVSGKNTTKSRNFSYVLSDTSTLTQKFLQTFKRRQSFN